MLLYLSSIIALVVLAPMAAGDDCRCKFAGMRGFVFMHTDKTLSQMLRPSVSLFEVNYQVDQAFFYPPGNDFRNNNVYIQDLKTNNMYIYPYRNGIRTGKCMRIEMPKDLMVPSCLPSSWGNKTTGSSWQLNFVPDINAYRQSFYTVNAYHLCEAHRIYQLYKNEKDNINLDLIVTSRNLNFSTMKPRFKLDTTNCLKENLDDLANQPY